MSPCGPFRNGSPYVISRRNKGSNCRSAGNVEGLSHSPFTGGGICGPALPPVRGVRPPWKDGFSAYLAAPGGSPACARWALINSRKHIFLSPVGNLVFDPSLWCPTFRRLVWQRNKAPALTMPQTFLPISNRAVLQHLEASLTASREFARHAFSPHPAPSIVSFGRVRAVFFCRCARSWLELFQAYGSVKQVRFVNSVFRLSALP